jgi:hypothetical protein
MIKEESTGPIPSLAQDEREGCADFDLNQYEFK